jgi:hypothetical protein
MNEKSEAQKASEEWQKAYEALSPEQKAASWDRYHGLTERTWHLYECSDCDPDPMFADEEDKADPDHPSNLYSNKALIVLPSDIERPNYCPRCESYLSLGDPTVVRVTTLGSKPNLTPKEDNT